MQITMKCLSGKKKSLAQDDYINPSGLPLLIERSQTEEAHFHKSADAQGKTSDHLHFILTCLSISLWFVKNFCFGKEHVSQRTDRKLK